MITTKKSFGLSLQDFGMNILQGVRNNIAEHEDEIRHLMQTKKDAEERQAEPVPLHLRNAVTKLMTELDYGKGYQYAHDTQEKITNMECLPESLRIRQTRQTIALWLQQLIRGRTSRVMTGLHSSLFVLIRKSSQVTNLS
jgi:hypothetical protein